MIKDLIEIGKETEYLDFKLKIDFLDNKIDFLKDINAFSNNGYDGHQYLVYGIKITNDSLDLIGINDFNYGDPANIQKLVSDKIEPNIKIEFLQEKYDEKIFLIIVISANKKQRPFMFKSSYNYGNSNNVISEGEAWIRLGSFKRKMFRSDFEDIYGNRKDPLVLKLRDGELFINNQDPAKLDLIIKNPSDTERVFSEVFLKIADHNDNDLTVIKMHRFISREKDQKGTFSSDFFLSVPSKTELIGTGEFSFSSSQAGIVGLNEYGESFEEYIFHIKLRCDEEEYLYTFKNCSIFAKGAVLRKIIGTVKRRNQ